MNREAIFQALFNLLTADGQNVNPMSGPFKYASRRLRLWNAVPDNMKPALFLLARDNTYTRSQPVPAKVTLQADVIIYFYTPPPAQADDNPPSPQVNDFLDLIDAALAPPLYTTLQQLGGLVNSCWIEGDVKVDTGEVDGQGVVIIPMKILVPT